MANANITWQGGATAVTQIERFALQNDFNDSETALIMTMTDENGGTETATIDPSGTDESAIAALWLTALQAKTTDLFTAVAWTVSGATVTGTARISGIPFYAASSVTGGAGSVNDSESTASAGPNDVNTAANYVGGSKFGADDKVRVLPHPTNDLSYAMLYGLDQSALDIQSLNVGETFDKDIGQTANSFYLMVDVSNITTDADPRVIFNGRGGACWISGTLDNVYIIGGINSQHMLHTKGTVPNTFVNGSAVQGTLTMESGAMDNLYIEDSPGLTFRVKSAVSSFDLLEMNSGTGEYEDDPADGCNFNVNGGQLTISTTDWSASGGTDKFVNVRGGLVLFNSGGVLDDLVLYAGEFSTSQNQSGALAITDHIMYGGILNVKSGLNNVTFANASSRTITKHGGLVIGDIAITPLGLGGA